MLLALCHHNKQFFFASLLLFLLIFSIYSPEIVESRDDKYRKEIWYMYFDKKEPIS